MDKQWHTKYHAENKNALWGKSKMDNPEKLATYGTQDEDKENKNAYICVYFTSIAQLFCQMDYELNS
jgi:hypothetical protein